MKRDLSIQTSNYVKLSKKSRDEKVNQDQFGKFLFEEISSLNQSQLIGTVCAKNEKVECISNFLARHGAMTILAPLSTPVEEDKDCNDGLIPAANVEMYMQEYRLFSKSQLHKVASSLVNPLVLQYQGDGEQQQILDKGVTRIESVLETIMVQATYKESSLRPKDLQRLHASLLHAISHYQKGSYEKEITDKQRKKSSWRKSSASDEIFASCSPDDIAAQMTYMLKGIKILQKKMNSEESSQYGLDAGKSSLYYSQSLIKALCITAALVYGLFDIHPFSESNNAFARVCINWALRRYANFPFPVHISFFSESVNDSGSTTKGVLFDAFDHIRSNINSYYKRKSSSQTSPFNGQPILQPLVQLILDQIYTQTKYLNNHLSAKFQTFNTQGIDRTLRKSRENSIADGTCVICLGDNPNIATLCCGNVLHFNCLAEWLTRKGNCVSCRKDLPMLKVEKQEVNNQNAQILRTGYMLDGRSSYPVVIFNENHSVDSHSTDGHDHLSILDDHDTYISWSDYDDSSSEESDDDDSDDSDSDDHYSSLPSLDGSSRSSQSELDDFVEEQGDADVSSASSDGTNIRSGRMLTCIARGCNNTAAIGCTNGCCARCCHLYFRPCPRHGSE